MSKGTNYKFNQLFGYRGPNQKINEQDIITVMKFDSTGQHLALGDKAGRVIIFNTDKNSKKKQMNYDYYAQFQSHNAQFDSLNSEQITETINDICWMNNQYKYQKVLTTNSKSIKLWKIFDKTQKKVGKSCGQKFNMPSLQTVDNSLIANLQQTFPSKHHTHIQSISKSYNEQYLLSFDQVQGFMWNLQRPDKPYLAVDYLGNLQPQDVKQNISCGLFHPSSDSILAYGTNKKTLKIHDMRLSSKQNDKTLKFKYESKQPKNFFTDFVQNYSSIQFLKDGKYLAVRDYVSVKVWDVANTKKPLLDVTINESLKSKFCDLFEKDCFEDKFKLATSPDSNTLLTGTYNNCFHLVDVDNANNTQYQLNYKKTTVNRKMIPQKSPALAKLDHIHSTKACDFHGKKNTVAVASLNCFFIYSMQ